MNGNDHERARKLLAADAVEVITAGERDWLVRHLATCHDCSSEAEAVSAAIRSLRVMSVTASPELVRRTRTAVRIRAQELHAERARSAPLWIATAMSSVWMILTAPYVWRAFAWFGQMVHVHSAVLETCFLMWWFLPATILGTAAAFRHTTKDHVSNWLLQSNWGQQ